MFDTHCHYNDKKLLRSYKELLLEARKNGVKYINVVGWDIESSKTAIEIAKNSENVFASVGIHPSDVIKADESHLQELEKLVTDKKVVAVGEIGLDYHWVKDEEGREKQKEYFIKQIAIANKYKLPITIHVRDAFNDALNILREHTPQYGGIMHLYSGSVEMVDEFIKLGLYISLGGPVTFTNAKTPPLVAKHVPIDKLLVETDAPYLTPHPHRGKLNHSAYLPLIAQKIAELRGESYEYIVSKTTENALRIFHVEQ